MAGVIRTITTVAVTAGGGRLVHKGMLVQDSDRERPYNGLDALCGSDAGRRGSVQARRVTDLRVSCGKCLRRPEQVGVARSFPFGD